MGFTGIFMGFSWDSLGFHGHFVRLEMRSSRHLPSYALGRSCGLRAVMEHKRAISRTAVQASDEHVEPF